MKHGIYEKLKKYIGTDKTVDQFNNCLDAQRKRYKNDMTRIIDE